MDKKSTYGLKVEQLADLLSIGIEEADFIDKISGDGATEELMEEWLITSLPREASLIDALLVIMGQMGYGIESLTGKSLSEVILDLLDVARHLAQPVGVSARTLRTSVPSKVWQRNGPALLGEI